MGVGKFIDWASGKGKVIVCSLGIFPLEVLYFAEMETEESVEVRKRVDVVRGVYRNLKL